MPDPWDANLTKQRTQLSVFAGPDLLKSPAWGANLFKGILDEFNKLSSSLKLKVTLVQTSIAPDPNGPGGANVQIEVSNGNHTFTVDGKQETGSLDPPPNINGICHRILQGGEMKRAFIFLPTAPRIDLPTPSVPSPRFVGEGVRIAVALHEVLHACGLGFTDPGHHTGLERSGSLQNRLRPRGTS